MFLAIDDKEQAAIARRAAAEKERMERIFNPKVRCLGIDLNALDQQVQFKTDLKEAEKQANDAKDRQTVLEGDILQLIEKEAAQSRRQQLIEVNDFRLKHQKRHEKRDFDLYDPERLRKDRLPRNGDIDPECGPSTAQLFEGEDLNAKQRIEQQRAQMKVWTQVHMYEKEKARLNEVSEQEKYDQLQKNVTDKLNALNVAVNAAKREHAILDNNFNHVMAIERKRREQEQAKREQEMNEAEIVNHVNGSLLAETPNLTMKGHKVRVDFFKGITAEQKTAILETQEAQREAARIAKEKQRAQEADWAVKDLANRRSVALLDRANARAAKERALLVSKENELKALQDKKRQTYIDKVLYTNPPKEEFFAQFNTTSR